MADPNMVQPAADAVKDKGLSPDAMRSGGWTPGPWEIEDAPRRGAWIKGSTGEWSALACGDTDASAAANARLIAATPALYEALVLILPLAKGYAPEGQTATARETCKSWIAAAEAALALASEQP